MRLTFICGSFEFGADGVGDYTRRLARELIKQGHQINVIALYDKWVSEVSIGFEDVASISLQVLRIPFNTKKQIRLLVAQKMINEFDPEILSLQFVIFSFNNKGLPFKLKNLLYNLGINRVWHIMFHELWVGMTTDSGIKMILWGWVQKQIIRNLLLKLKPALIHTQTQIYQAQLIKLGFSTMYLPLFGNIPVIDQHSSIAAVDKLPLKEISFVLFGSIHPGAPVEALVKDVANYTKKFKVPVSLKIMGRSGTEQQRWVRIWKSAGLEIVILGELPAENVSKHLSNSTLGITSTPIALAEKSGTIAAMKEHGLKVLCVSLPWQERHSLSFAAPVGIMEYNGNNINEILNCKIKLPVGSPIKKIAEQLVEDCKIRTSEIK